jgi:hypothetical protein
VQQLIPRTLLPETDARGTDTARTQTVHCCRESSRACRRGAHCSIVRDASMTTYLLSHWPSPRRRPPAAHDPRFVAVGVHSGSTVRRSRTSQTRSRLRRRGSADRSTRPAPQHPRRAAHAFPGRGVDRGGRRLRGLRDDENVLTLDPQLPNGTSRLAFRSRWQGRAPTRRHR